VLANGWQTIPERGVVRSREPLKFWWAPIISLERLIVLGALNLVGWLVWQTGDGLGHQFITLTVDICVQHDGPEALRRSGLSAAAKPFLLMLCARLSWLFVGFQAHVNYIVSYRIASITVGNCIKMAEAIG